MRIRIAAIGKAKASPEQELVSQYLTRLPWNVEFKELEVKRELPDEKRKEAEAALLLDACKTDGRRALISLDEKGRTLSSPEFATLLSTLQMDGVPLICFTIGGQDGLHRSVLDASDSVLSFGRMTWPHMLVRPLLAEQLYRAHTIQTNHPYHRN